MIFSAIWYLHCRYVLYVDAILLTIFWALTAVLESTPPFLTLSIVWLPDAVIDALLLPVAPAAGALVLLISISLNTSPYKYVDSVLVESVLVVVWSSGVQWIVNWFLTSWWSKKGLVQGSYLS